MTLTLLCSPLPKSSLSLHYAAGQRGSPPRLDLASPEPPLGFQPGSRVIRGFVPGRGSQMMVALSASLGCAWFLSPSPGLAVCALGGMHLGEIPQGFVPPGRKGKGRNEAGCPCPQPRKRQRNPVGPGWSSPGAYHTWDPGLGAGAHGACCRETLSLQQGCPGGVALEGDNSPQRPHVCLLQAQPQFCSKCDAPGQVGEHWSHPSTRSGV